MTHLQVCPSWQVRTAPPNYRKLKLQYTEQALFDRLATLEGEKLIQSEDIKQLKNDFKFNKKTNLDGLPPEIVALVSKAAVIHARNVYEEQRSQQKAIFDKYEELAGYNE